jgi:hypothetical protein
MGVSRTMPRIIKMPALMPTGLQEFDAYELTYETIKEDWNQYRLPDGRLVRVKVIVSRIAQVVDADGNEQLNPDGSPFLILSNRVEVVAEI